jgi:DNA-binding transcriptional regulator PaaX
LKGSFTAVRFALCWKFSNKNQWYRRFLNKFRIFRISFL